MHWIDIITPPIAIIIPCGLPSAWAVNPNIMNRTFPMDTSIRIPITKIGVQEYSVRKWNEVLSSHSIDGIRNRTKATASTLIPEPDF